MIHGRSQKECETTAHRLAALIGVSEYRLLFSTREYKKSSPRYTDPGRAPGR